MKNDRRGSIPDVGYSLGTELRLDRAPRVEHRLWVFPRLAPAADFPEDLAPVAQFDWLIDWLISQAGSTFLRLAPITSFPALSSSYRFFRGFELRNLLSERVLTFLPACSPRQCEKINSVKCGHTKMLFTLINVSVLFFTLPCNMNFSKSIYLNIATNSEPASLE